MNSTLEEIETLNVMGDHIECGFRHEASAVPQRYRECMGEVTHIVETPCKGHPPLFTCATGAAAIAMFMRGGKSVKCKTCGEPVGTHWTMRKI